MSFLSILIVASAFYFGHARTDFPSWSEAFNSAREMFEEVEVHDAPAVPETSSVPITDPKDYQHQLFSFMQDLSRAVDQYMTPLMTKLDVEEQNELKNMGLNGFASYINYLLLLIQEKEYEKYNDDGHGQDHGDSLPRNEMFIEFQSDYHLDPHIPFMAYTQDEEEA